MRKVFQVPADLDQLGWLTTYPGITPEESRPLKAFIQMFWRDFDEVRFDVRVGPGEAAPEGADDALRRAIEQGTRMRMDAVAWKAPNVARLIECKKDADNAAIWQLLGYRDHYVAEHPNDVIQLWIVAESATSTARSLAASQGIFFALFPGTATNPTVSATPTPERPDGV